MSHAVEQFLAHKKFLEMMADSSHCSLSKWRALCGGLRLLLGKMVLQSLVSHEDISDMLQQD